jgi:hypothetical protein
MLVLILIILIVLSFIMPNNLIIEKEDFSPSRYPFYSPYWDYLYYPNWGGYSYYPYYSDYYNYWKYYDPYYRRFLMP